MNLARLSWTYLWARPVVTLLNLALLALGLASIAFVLLVSVQVEDSLERDVQGVDLVVGAKGSPLQLILAGIYHLDVPTGNIPLQALAQLAAHPLVKSVVPMSLGDSFRGFRIVGTTGAYVDNHAGRLARGRLWSAPMEAVLGAEVAKASGLAPGQTFKGSHGLGDAGDTHDLPYRVVGVLAPGAGVLDRLVLTPIESVWAVHEHGHAADQADGKVHDEQRDEQREVTLLLLTYKSPLAAASLPRFINSSTDWQAASPALEVARLMRMVGVGVDVLRGFGLALLAAAALSCFIGLYHAVRERLPDLAMLRMLGASPGRVATLLLCEALWLAGLGLAAGLLLGHGAAQLLGGWLQSERSLAVTGLAWPPVMWSVPLLAVGVAAVAAILPAWTAYRLDVTQLLQEPR